MEENKVGVAMLLSVIATVIFGCFTLVLQRIRNE